MSSPISRTGLAVVTDRLWSLRLFYQLHNGHIEQSRHVDGVWTNEQLTFRPVDGTPLASITYGGGREVRVYYLDTSHTVQEFCYSQGRGWYQGEIGQMKTKATPGAGLAAIAFGSDVLGSGEKGVHIRVYCQEAGTNNVIELANDGYWHAGDMRISDAHVATGLAAVTYYFQEQTQIRVYYQSRDLSLKEHGHNNRGWFTGAFNPGKAADRTPLAALAFGNVELEVYYRDAGGRLVFVKNTGSWGGANVIHGVGPSFNFAVLQWEKGTRLRLYYQEPSGPVVELCSDNGGQSWFPGELKVGK